MSVCGYSIFDLYEISPYVTLGAVFFFFILRCRLSVRGVLLWTLFVGFACARLGIYRFFGSTTQHPSGVPEALVRVLDVAYFGTGFLAVIAAPFFFWRSQLKAFILPIVAYSLSLGGVLNAIATPVVRHYAVASSRVPNSLNGYRIVHISDIHAYCGCRRWHTQKIVDTANALHADLVCVTGDFADGHPAECADYLAPLLALRAKDGVYAVTGNHETTAINPVREWCAFYQTWGMSFLHNGCVFPRMGLALGGVDDEGELANGNDVAKVFAAATNGEFRVLLKHRPEGAEKNIGQCGVALQLSGHLHGGFMPILREYIATSNNHWTSGLYVINDGFLCVSAGCGPWGIFPLRYRTPLEVGLITLRHNKN